MLGTLLTFLIVGLVTMVVAGIALAVIGTALSLAFFLLFKVAPVLLVGWVVVKLFEKSRRHDALSEADRKWLEGE
jgi:hypothetical protein